MNITIEIKSYGDYVRSFKVLTNLGFEYSQGISGLPKTLKVDLLNNRFGHYPSIRHYDFKLDGNRLIK